MITGTTWVHVFERDTPAGAVFWPDTADIPLSRRPRARFTLSDDGSAELLAPGPDDRFVAQPGQWSLEGGGIVVRDAGGHQRLQIVETARDQLVVRVT